MSAIELLPCPFCGGDNTTTGMIGYQRRGCCKNCGATSAGADNETNAIAAWNRRTDMSQASVAAALEAAADKLSREWPGPAVDIVRALIAPAQRTALQAAIDAAKAEARAEDAAKIEALTIAAHNMKSGLLSALQCKDFAWDNDQRRYAEEYIANYDTLAQNGYKL